MSLLWVTLEAPCFPDPGIGTGLGGEKERHPYLLQLSMRGGPQLCLRTLLGAGSGAEATPQRVARGRRAALGAWEGRRGPLPAMGLLWPAVGDAGPELDLAGVCAFSRGRAVLKR